jgi:hypothetical protein
VASKRRADSSINDTVSQLKTDKLLQGLVKINNMKFPDAVTKAVVTLKAVSSIFFAYRFNIITNS